MIATAITRSTKKLVAFDIISVNCEVKSMVVGVFYRYGNTLRWYCIYYH